jgi:hypothetical protein
MLRVERFYRRIAYCFGISLIVTAGFTASERFFYLPAITWVVAIVLFALSWRIQKEYTALIGKSDKPDNDPIAWVVGHKPHLYHLLWAAVYTFGTYIVVALPLQWFAASTVEWRPFFAIWLIVLFLLSRFVDPKVRKSFYNKKS